MTEDKMLEALLKILTDRLAYMKVYTDVNVYTVQKTKKLELVDGKLVEVPIPETTYVVVEYSKPKLEFMNQSGFERIEFPISDLEKRLEHYRNKLKYEKEKFNSNLTVKV